MVEYLTQMLHCDPNSTYKSNVPLHVAACLGDLNAVKFLIGNGKCDPNVKGGDGRQPIHDAAEEGRLV